MLVYMVVYILTPSLRHNSFICHSNAFSGTLPSSIGDWSGLTYFEAGKLDSESWYEFVKDFSNKSNFFSGPLPDSIANWRSLVVGAYFVLRYGCRVSRSYLCLNSH